MKNTFYIIVLLILCNWSNALYAQNLLYGIDNGVNGGYAFGYYNIETCTYCFEMEVPLSTFPTTSLTDVVPLANGNIVTVGYNGVITTFNPPNVTPLSTYTITVAPGNFIVTAGAILAPNGNVYISGGQYTPTNDYIGTIWEYNPVTNTASVLTTFAINTVFPIELFYWNGILYSVAPTNVSSMGFALISVVIGPPATYSIIYNYPGVACGGPTAVIPTGANAGIYTLLFDPNCGGNELFEFDLNSNSTSLTCDFSPQAVVYGLGYIPAGFPPPPTNCACVTDAGSVPTPNAELCVGETLSFSNIGDLLDANDTKQYILFTNPSDTLGSIVATSNTPSFSFAPPLQTGITYYAATIVGNNVSGNVDLTDPCLDISNAITVIWQPRPTVVMTVANPNACAGGCQTVQLQFTGTPPFNLTYSATSLPGQMTQTFSANTGVLTVCPSAGFTGAVQVLATSLTDANCTCP